MARGGLLRFANGGWGGEGCGSGWVAWVGWEGSKRTTCEPTWRPKMVYMATILTGARARWGGAVVMGSGLVGWLVGDDGVGKSRGCACLACALATVEVGE